MNVSHTSQVKRTNGSYHALVPVTDCSNIILDTLHLAPLTRLGFKRHSKSSLKRTKIWFISMDLTLSARNSSSVDLKLIKFGARYEFIVEVKPTASSRLLQRVVRR